MKRTDNNHLVFIFIFAAMLLGFAFGRWTDDPYWMRFVTAENVKTFVECQDSTPIVKPNH